MVGPVMYHLGSARLVSVVRGNLSVAPWFLHKWLGDVKRRPSKKLVPGCTVLCKCEPRDIPTVINFLTTCRVWKPKLVRRA
jgi:hypothetical protein